MHLRGKHIDKLGPEDISNLIENRVSESIMLDYKEELPNLKDNGQKLKWLALVSSFANKDGGVIIYGIKEKRDNEGKSEGVPEEITGLVDLHSDQIGLQMGQVLNAGLDPKLPTPRFRSMEIDGKTIFIIGIQRSLFAPHVVWFEKDGRFWVRNNNGKEQMDVHQLRRAFLQSEEWEKEADNFRRKRIMDVRSGEFIPELRTEGSFFVHVLPLGHTGNSVDISRIPKETNVMVILPGRVSQHVRFNLDGFLVCESGPVPKAFIQYHRNGGLEYYTTKVQYHLERYGRLCVDGTELENTAMKFVEDSFIWCQAFSVELPIIIYMSLHDVAGLPLTYLLTRRDNLWETDPFTIDRDQILFPGVLVDDWSADVKSLLKGTFDSLAQCGGYAASHRARS